MKRTILSVCNYDLDAVRDYSQTGVTAFKSHYHIPAAEMGKYNTLEVHDAWDRFHVGDLNFSNQPEYGENIAQDIVDQWTTGASAPPAGVVILRGENPTQADIEAGYAQAMAQHRRYCEYRRNMANELWVSGKREAVMTSMYQNASRWLGSDNDPWCMVQMQPKLMQCPWCRTAIPEEAAVCSECGKISNFEKYQELLEKQSAIEARFAKPAAAPAPPPQFPVKPGAPAPVVRA